MKNLFLLFGLRHLREKWLRTLLTLLGIAFGVALWIAISIINRSTLNTFRENIESVAGKAQLTVTAGKSGFSESILEQVKSVEGVGHAVPMIESRAFFAGTGDKNQSLYIFGVDLLQESAVRTYKTTDEKVIDDPLVFLNQPDSIIVTKTFAELYHLEIDSKIKLATANGVKSFTVRGMLSPEGTAKAYGGGLALMDIDGARMMFGKENKIDRIDLVPAAGKNVDELQADVQKKLGPGYSVERPETMSKNMEKMVSGYQTMLLFFSSIALLVGLFLVLNTVSISVAERKREIGSLRALGATRKGILFLFCSEATLIGFLGSLLGLGLGRILAQLMVKGVTDSMSAQMLNRVSVTHLEFTYQHQLQGILVGTLTAFVASLWPSWRATWIKPVEAMKNRDELGDAKSRLNQKTPLLGVLMMGLMLLLTLTGLTQKNIWVEHFSQFCAVVGSALLGPWIVTSFLKLIRPLLVRHGSTVARLSHDNILRNPRRTAGNIMSLMVGLLLVMLIACVQASFKDTIFQWFDKILKADILVSSNGRVISYEMQPVHEELWKKIETIEGVMPSPEGSYQAMRMVHLQYEGQQISLKAYDEPPLELKYSNFDVKDRSTEKAGYDLFHSTEPTVLVSENFVMHYGLKTGDTLNLATPSGSQKFKIVGVMTDFASPRGVLYMDRKYFREYWKDPLVSFFAVSIKKGYALENIRREIESRLGQENNLIAISNRDLREQLMGSIEHSFAYTRAVESAALLVALLGLLNTLLISVMERTREIGMCRAIGMSRSQVSSMIMRESLLQGGLGALVATLLGSLLAWVWINYSLSHVLGWIVHFSFPWMSILTTVLIGVCVAWLAGIYPSRRAARLEIREALDVE